MSILRIDISRSIGYLWFVMRELATQQLQIRVSPSEKARIQRAAMKAGKDMSSWVRERLLPSSQSQFHELLRDVRRRETRREALAELNTLLANLAADEFCEAVEDFPENELSEYDANYIAAMVEVAAHQKSVPAPSWTKNFLGLAEPSFGSSLESVRLYLLTSSPPPFRRRNIFIDSTVGDRV